MEIQEQSHYIVDGALEILLRVSRWAGLAPLRFEPLRSGGYKCSISKPLFIVSCVGTVCFNITVIVILITILTSKDMEDTTKSAKDSITLVYIFISIFIIDLSITSIAILGAKRRVMRLIDIAKQIEATNKTLNIGKTTNVPGELKPWKICAIIFGCIFVQFSVLFIYFLRYSQTTRLSKLIYISHLVESLPLTLLIIQRLYIILVLKLSITIVNDGIKQLVLNEEIETLQYSLSGKKLRNLYNSYQSICKVINDFNDLDGVVMFLLICNEIFNLMLTVFFMSRALKVTTNFGDWLVIQQYMWLIFHSIKLVIYIEPSHQIIGEIEKTKVLVSTMMSKYSAFKQLRKEFGCFFRHLSFNQPSLKPAGIFNNERSLIVGIAGFVVSYLMILVEFKLK